MLLRCITGWLLFAGLIFAQSGVSEAQMATDATIEQVLDRLMQNDAAYRANQPSFSVHESIVSRYDEVVLFGHSVDKAEATVRMGPQTLGGPFKESRQITMFNGRPVKGEQPHLIFDFTDDFADFANAFFSAKHRRCYNFMLEPKVTNNGPWQVDVSVSPAAAGVTDCVFALDGLTAMVRVDPVTYQIIHLECKSPAALAVPIHRPLFVSADYAPVRVGEETFWLPTNVIAKGSIGKTPYKWVSHYSDYHRYTSSVTILPADSSTQ
jgi:hypothetical protein